MERFTEEELNFLGGFEGKFACVLDSNYLRGIAYSDAEQMRIIWERVTKRPYKLHHDCGRCMYDFLYLVGAEYRKQKAEQAQQAQEEKPKKKNPTKKAK